MAGNPADLWGQVMAARRGSWCTQVPEMSRALSHLHFDQCRSPLHLGATSHGPPGAAALPASSGDSSGRQRVSDSACLPALCCSQSAVKWRQPLVTISSREISSIKWLTGKQPGFLCNVPVYVDGCGHLPAVYVLTIAGLTAVTVYTAH